MVQSETVGGVSTTFSSPGSRVVAWAMSATLPIPAAKASRVREVCVDRPGLRAVSIRWARCVAVTVPKPAIVIMPFASKAALSIHPVIPVLRRFAPLIRSAAPMNGTPIALPRWGLCATKPAHLFRRTAVRSTLARSTRIVRRLASPTSRLECRAGTLCPSVTAEMPRFLPTPLTSSSSLVRVRTART
jgi:hypothetical protein